MEGERGHQDKAETAEVSSSLRKDNLRDGRGAVAPPTRRLSHFLPLDGLQAKMQMTTYKSLSFSMGR